MRAIFDVGTVAGLSDTQLLERFVTRGGEPAELAFAALVERHGPMVLRVCRGVLGDAHAAEDAFQATFLVLVRKARSIRDRHLLGNWLHGVALRVSTCALASAARRKRHEQRAGARATSRAASAEVEDLARAIHEEVGRLPDRYRVPMVLCCLEGQSLDEAAIRLRVPVGTIKSRLARGRERLRGLLARRGVGPATMSTSAVLVASESFGAVPALLTEVTIQAATRCAASPAAFAAGSVPAAVAALSAGVLKAMFWTKLRVAATATAVTILVAATGAGVLARQAGPAFVPAQTSEATPEKASPRGDRMKELENKLDRVLQALENIARPPGALTPPPVAYAPQVAPATAPAGALGYPVSTITAVPAPTPAPATNQPLLATPHYAPATRAATADRLSSLERSVDELRQRVEQLEHRLDGPSGKK
jgi:RNA polymerase sigma factor (sigma-70 family)